MLSVLEDFLKHIVFRYGVSEVSRWRFDCWYHPIRKTFCGIRSDDFAGVFERVSTKIKAIIPGAMVGGWGIAFMEHEADRERESRLMMRLCF